MSYDIYEFINVHMNPVENKYDIYDSYMSSETPPTVLMRYTPTNPEIICTQLPKESGLVGSFHQVKQARPRYTFNLTWFGSVKSHEVLMGGGSQMLLEGRVKFTN